jgi:hypothetical protein
MTLNSTHHAKRIRLLNFGNCKNKLEKSDFRKNSSAHNYVKNETDRMTPKLGDFF